MRVLIVEDEKKLAELLKKSLKEENHSVSLAFDGRVALGMAQALEYDAMVLDLMFPEIDGFEVARRLRNKGLNVFINLLRNKVDRDHKVKLIQTVCGTGYTIRDTTEA